MRPYVLAESNWKTVRDGAYDLAILPWGATEAHNLHLPYATDNIQAEFVAIEAAAYAWEAGAKSIVLPCIPFGVNTGQMEIPWCVNMSPSTQLSVLEDIAEVVINAGVEKLLILNGHGGNHFETMLRELSLSHPDLFCCTTNWYEVVPAENFFEEPGDHAGEMESSCILHLAPESMRTLQEAGSGKSKAFRIQGLKEGWVAAQRHWIEVTDDTGVGDPSRATAEKGQAFLEAAIHKIGEFLVELAAADLDQMYR